MEEIWKDIKGYEGLYQVSSFGNVINLKTSKFLKPTFSQDGYLIFHLAINKKFKRFKTHRLVAKAFIPNYENRPQVNHINGVKTDNKINNLEWATQSENMKHSFMLGLHKKKFKQDSNFYNLKRIGLNNPKSRLVIDLNTGIFYNCVRDASVAYGYNYSTLKDYLVGRIKNKTSLIYI